MIHIKNNTQYYINSRALSFSENDLDDPNRVAVSIVSGTVIMVYEKGVIDYAADGNYEKWTLRGYSTRLVKNGVHYIYARLSRSDKTALVVFSAKDYNLDGSIKSETDGNDTPSGTTSSENYFYVKIGELTATDGSSLRELTYDSGLLGTEKSKEETGGLAEMWELDKAGTPWLIRAKQWLSSFTVKGFITLVGGLVFRKGNTEKTVTDIKRSVDSDDDVPVGDSNLATSAWTADYVEGELEKLDDRFLSKVKDDETPYSLGVGRDLAVGGDVSVGNDVTLGGDLLHKDYASGTRNGGYAIRQNEDGEYEVEADHVIARILGNVYDLLVKNHATFVGDLSSEEFISGFLSGKGWSIRMKDFINAAGVKEKKSVAEFDDLIVRGSMRIYEFIVSQMLGENDNRIFTGMMEVDHYDAMSGKVYLKTDGGRLYNPFRVDDVVIVQQYGGNPSQENGYYVTKQYEFIITGAGVGEDGEDRLDWVTFRNFTTSIEGGSESLITERDTLVRIDNISDANRKGIIQLMSVGEDTPYMDFIYGAKTDPENSLKGRLGNLGGVYNPLFGWLKEFGAYLTNLYAVGEFVIAHTGEDVSDAINIAKSGFRTNYRQITYDMTEEQNFLANASMTNDCEGWILGEDSSEYFLVDGLPQYFNYDLYATEKTYAGIEDFNDRDMLRVFSSSARQENSLIRKPSTHKVYTGTKENADGSSENTYREEVDTTYLNIRFYCHADGELEVGFANNGTFYNNAFHSKASYKANIDSYTISLSGKWDGIGDFYIKTTGDFYIDLLSFTDKPLENYMISTSTAIEQDATRISLLGKKVNGLEGSVTQLGVDLNAAEERIRLYVDKKVEGVEASVSALNVRVNGIDTLVGSLKSSSATKEELEKFKEDAADEFKTLTENVKTSLDWKKTFDDKQVTATSIIQTRDTVNSVAGAFEKQSDGSYKLTTAAGSLVAASVNEAVASLYAKKKDVEAELSAKVSFDASTGKITSSVKISADQIDISANEYINIINKGTTTIKAERVDLIGKVTFSMLDSSTQSTVNSKVDQNAVNTSINNFKGTIIEGDKIKSEYLYVNEIYATKGTVGGFTIEENKLHVTGSILTGLKDMEYTNTLSVEGLEIKDASSEIVVTTGLRNKTFEDKTWLTALSVVNNQSAGNRRSGDMCAVYLKTTTNDICLLAEGGNTLLRPSAGCLSSVYGLALAANRQFSGTAATNMDILVVSGTAKLPSASTCRGKMYFTKILSGSLTVNNVYISDSAGVTSSGTWTDANARLFFSDGTYWHEINGV